MGLDVTAYRQLKPDPNVRIVDGEPDEDRYWERLASIRYVGGHFADRADGIPEGYFEFAERHAFRGGSYSGYGQWREWLAKLAGYPAAPSEYGHEHAAGAWAASGGPFWELINFSDCEGVIGPTTSAKLARDFAEWDERAKAANDTWEYERYQHWRKAFELAADGGAVDFH